MSLVVTPIDTKGCLMHSNGALICHPKVYPLTAVRVCWRVPGDIMGSLWPRSRLQSPLRILSDAPKFRAECLQTLRDGEVEEESAAPPSIYTTITTPLVHDFIICLTGEFGPYLEGKTRRFNNTSCWFSLFWFCRLFPARSAVSQRPLGLWSARRGVGRAPSS